MEFEIHYLKHAQSVKRWKQHRINQITLNTIASLTRLTHGLSHYAIWNMPPETAAKSVKRWEQHKVQRKSINNGKNIKHLDLRFCFITGIM